MTAEELAAYEMLWQLTARTHAAKLARLEAAAVEGREAIAALPDARALHSHAVRQETRIREEMKRR